MRPVTTSDIGRLSQLLAVMMLSLPSWSQTRAFHPDSINPAVIVEVGGGIALPGADLAKRFGLNGLAGLGVGTKTANNWYFKTDGSFLFGSDVKEDSLLRGISTDSGFVIGLDGFLYEPLIYERGFLLSVGGGRILSLSARYPNSGVMIGLRASFLQHKILYSTKAKENLPQLSTEMRKGYDRLTNGFGLTQEVAWHQMSRSGLINFRIGLEITEAFTRSRRPFNYDTMSSDDESRLDLLFALKFTWMLPIWLGQRDRVIYYE